MSGYRGIFLDSIHPNIRNRLNADTFGMGRKNISALDDSNSTEILRYLTERTPWVRAVPFTIPQEIYGVNNRAVNPDVEEGDQPDTEIMAPSSSMKLIVEEYPKVPHWRNWVLWGTKARSIHGSEIDSHIHPAQPYSQFENTNLGTKDSTATFGDKLYSNSYTGWDGKTYAGVYQSPPPGITGLSVSNKGDLGTIRRATLNIKAHNLPDLEALEMMYMVPGMTILIEWGWYHPKMYVDPIDVETIKSGDALNSTRAINEKILYKTFDIKDGELHNIGDPTAFNTADATLGTKAGLYDGFLGTITKFSWTNDGSGGYDIKVEIIAPGSLTTGISVQTYKMATKIYDQETETEIAYTDIQAAAAILQQSTLQVEDILNQVLVGQNVRGENVEIPPQIRTTEAGDGYESNGSVKSVKIPVKTQALDRGNKGVIITKGEKEGELNYEVSVLDPENPPTETVDYFLEEYKGGNEFEVTRIKGDPMFWRYCIAWLSAGEVDVNDQHGHVAIQNLQAKGRDDLMCNYAGDDDEEYNVKQINAVCGEAFRSGNYYVYKDDDCWGRSGPGSWFMKVWVDGKYVQDIALGDHVDGGSSKIKLNGKDKEGWHFQPGVTSDVTPGNNYHKGEYRTPKMVDPSTNPDWSDGGKNIKRKNLVDYLGDIDGQMRMNAAAEKYGWEVNPDGGYTDANGNAINAAGLNPGNPTKGSGSEWDPVVVKKVEGVSVIERRTNENGEVTYTVVDHLQGENADSIKKEFNKAIKDKEQAVEEAAKLEAEQELEAARALVAGISNAGGVTWSGVSFGPSNYEFCTQVNLINPSLRRPTVDKDGVRIAYELGYDILDEDGANPTYPVGMVAYADTYVSFRFIEDYLVNELFMPRLEITGNDTGAVQPLESVFGSWDIMSDREKRVLSQGIGENELLDRNGNIDSELSAMTERGTDTERTLDIIKPVQIINHRNLRSMNSKVCILPGQEKPAFERDINGNSFQPNGDALNMIDYAQTLSPNKAKYDPNACGGRAMNKFTGITPEGRLDRNSGILRNMMFNIDFVNDIAKNSDNVRDFVMGLLDGANEACGKPWSFKIITISATNQLKVIDENYTPGIKTYREEAAKDMTTQEDESGGVKGGIYQFTGIGDHNILKDVKIQSKLPSELATAAYFATMNPDPDGNQNLNTFAMYGVGLTDRLKQLSRTVIVGDNGEQAMAARAAMVTSYLEGVINSRMDHLKLKNPATQINEGMKVALQYVNNYIHGNSFEVKNYAPPIPIDVSMTMHGISGIFMGNAVMLTTIAKGGILPTRYRGTVALQVTSVDHEITPETWDTSIDTLMRPLPMTERNAKVVKLTMQESTPPSDPVQTAGGLHPHWIRFLSGGSGIQPVPWSAGCISYILKKTGLKWPMKGAHTKYAQAIRTGGDKYDFEALDPATTPILVGDVVIKTRSNNKIVFTSNKWSGSSHGDIVHEVDSAAKKARIIGGNVSNTMVDYEIKLDNEGKIPEDNVNKGKNGSYFCILRAKAGTFGGTISQQKVALQAKVVFASYPGPEKKRVTTMYGSPKYNNLEMIKKADEATKEAAFIVYDMYKAGSCWSTYLQCSAPHPEDGLSASALKKSIDKAKELGKYNIDTGQLA